MARSLGEAIQLLSSDVPETGKSLEEELEALRAPRLRFHCEVSRGVALLAACEAPSGATKKLFERRPQVRYVVRAVEFKRRSSGDGG